MFSCIDGLCAIRNHRCSNALGLVFALTFQDAEHDCFASAPPPALKVLPPSIALVHESRFATDEGFIDFNFAAELSARQIVLHSEPDSMHHVPRGFLRDSEIAANFVTGYSVFAIREEPSQQATCLSRAENPQRSFRSWKRIDG